MRKHTQTISSIPGLSSLLWTPGSPNYDMLFISHNMKTIKKACLTMAGISIGYGKQGEVLNSTTSSQTS